MAPIQTRSVKRNQFIVLLIATLLVIRCEFRDKLSLSWTAALMLSALLAYSVYAIFGSANAARPCGRVELPDDIRNFAATIQGKSANEVRGMIEAAYGPPDRDIGFGLSIEQWDVSGGALTFHPLAGPSFDDGKTVFRLMKTTNLVKDCLFGSYEMTTLPDLENHANQFWIGNISISDSKYKFTDSNSNFDRRGDQKFNFFINNPAGNVRVYFPKGINLETKLESLSDNCVVATIEFISTDGKSRSKFNVLSNSSKMRLAFQADNITFEMDKGWSSYWK